MSEFSRKLPGSTDLGVALVRGLRESVFMIYVAMALFLFVALVTFDVDDAGWSHLGGAGRVANGAGAVGAWAADILLTVFGVTAYLLPFLLGGYGYTVFLGRSGPGPTSLQLGLRWTGFGIAVIASAALADVLLARPPLALPDSSGGILGRELASRLSGTFGSAGTSILLLTLFLAGVSVYTGLSWIGVLAWIGRRFHGVTSGLAALLRGAAADDLDEKPREANRAEGAMPSAAAKPAASQRPPLRPFVPEYEDDEEDYDPSQHLADVADAMDDDDLERFVPAQAGPEAGPMPLANRTAFDRDDLDIDLEEPSKPLAGPLVRPPSPPKPTPPPAAKKSNQPSLPTGSLPPVDLLSGNAPKIRGYSTAALEEMSRQVEAILDDFGVEVRVAEVHPGPVITRFEIEPAPGVKVSRISGLAKDLARALSVTSVRVVEVIPGKSVIGLEIPNEERETVLLRSLLSSNAYQEAGGPLTLVLGKDISGHSVVANLARMPHLLVAGTTGSGKSVAVNVMILSMLFKARPDEVRLIMIDPKMLELSVYEGIPHLLTPVVTDMKEAANALRWSVAEMERRYKLMSMLGVRNLAGFNQKVNDAIAAGEPIVDPTWNASEYLEGEEPPTLQPLPFIVIVIDELADMMMIVGKKVEELIARLAQKARAAGLHLILATQRPSVDVITGLIKANIPTRIAFQVSSRIDSRTIIDQGGAEALLGNGDMLYLPPGSGIPIRAHGAFVSDAEVHAVVEFLKRTGRANYLTEITRFSEDNGDGNGYRGSSSGGGDGEESDPLYDEAVRFVTESRKASISSVQRKFKVGYNRAARMIEDMENAGIVGAAETNGSREVLAPPPPPI